MKLFFLRHGAADWPDWRKPDEERPLTKAGRNEVRTVAKFLVKLKAFPSAILTSPLPRASQTADIAAEHLKVRCREEKLLAPGFGVTELSQVLRKYPEESLMLVGHEPDFTNTISALTGGRLKLSKAGVALVDIENPSPKGKLLWLFPPKIAKQ
jgi:phosphohistidine phosphatase